MNLVNWSPFRDMDSLLDRYFNVLGRVPAGGGEVAGKAFDWRPTVDISETKTHYLIKAELPEVEKDDVEVSVENGMLTISGERRFEKEEETETQHRIESMYGRFARSFALPADADEAKISAQSRNGVLKVRIPKTVESATSPKRISVD